MKTKSNKLILTFAAASALICATVRFFQIMTLTDFENGFFFRGSELGGALGYVLLGVCAVLLILLAFLGRKRGNSAYFVSSDGMGSNATRGLGAGEMIGGLLIGFRVTQGLDVFSMICEVILAAVFIISGAALMGRIKPPKFTGHIKLIAALFLFFRAATLFNSDLLIRQHAENLIVLFSLVLFSAFTAASARFYARVESKNTRLGEISLAAVTFLFSATHVISDLFAMAFGGAGASAFVSLSFEAAAAAVISGSFLVVIFFTEKKKDVVPYVEK